MIIKPLLIFYLFQNYAYTLLAAANNLQPGSPKINYSAETIAASILLGFLGVIQVIESKKKAEPKHTDI